MGLKNYDGSIEQPKHINRKLNTILISSIEITCPHDRSGKKNIKLIKDTNNNSKPRNLLTIDIWLFVLPSREIPA